MSLLYFAPGHERPRVLRDDLERLGLAHLFDDRSKTPASCGCRRGPSGGPGVTFAATSGTEGRRVGYHPERQTWRESDQGWWLGWWNEAPPTPRDLRRRETIPGVPVELADGQRWEVPVVRDWPLDGPLDEGGAHAGWTCELPVLLRRVMGRWETGPVVVDRRALWERSLGCFDKMIEAMRPDPESDDGLVAEFQIEDFYDHAAELLGVNYRLGPEEIGLLELFDTDGPIEVFRASVQFEKMLAGSKKNGPVTTAPSPPGGAGSPPLTDPPPPTTTCSAAAT